MNTIVGFIVANWFVISIVLGLSGIVFIIFAFVSLAEKIDRKIDKVSREFMDYVLPLKYRIYGCENQEKELKAKNYQVNIDLRELSQSLVDLEKELCFKISEDIALTASNIRYEMEDLKESEIPDKITELKDELEVKINNNIEDIIDKIDSLEEKLNRTIHYVYSKDADNLTFVHSIYSACKALIACSESYSYSDAKGKETVN